MLPDHDGEIELREMNRALSALPTGQRTALLLVSASGLSYEEAADDLRLRGGHDQEPRRPSARDARERCSTQRNAYRGRRRQARAAQSRAAARRAEMPCRPRGKSSIPP